MSLALSGIGISRGVAIGKAHIILRGSIEVVESAIPEHLVDDEIARFMQAIGDARQQLDRSIPGLTSPPSSIPTC
jgi:phosphotransferase system enzyme I (PtsI)